MRRRVRARKTAGLRPWTKDLLLLARHHSRPYQETQIACRMGKQGWNPNAWPKKDQQQPDKWSGSPASWSYWPGAWNKQGRGAQQQKSQVAPSAFPKYQSMAVPADASTAPPLTSQLVGDPLDGDQDAQDQIRSVQRWVNTVRKADNKLRKLREAQIVRDQQWTTYQQELRQQFSAQRKQYLEDCSTAKQELADLKGERDAAMLSLQACMTEGPMELDGPTQKPDGEDARHWEELMFGAANDSEEDKQLQRMLQEASQSGPGKLSPEDRAKVQLWINRQDSQRGSAGSLDRHVSARQGAASCTGTVTCLQGVSNGLWTLYSCQNCHDSPSHASADPGLVPGTVGDKQFATFQQQGDSFSATCLCFRYAGYCVDATVHADPSGRSLHVCRVPKCFEGCRASCIPSPLPSQASQATGLDQRFRQTCRAIAHQVPRRHARRAAGHQASQLDCPSGGASATAGRACGTQCHATGSFQFSGACADARSAGAAVHFARRRRDR